jgi:hypothetical protein
METGGDVLVFNPDTEFKVIEEFEFDELIQRPESVRFFTLTEQTSDFMDKLLPKTGKISKAILQKTEYEISAFKKLYSNILKETPTGFEEVQLTKPIRLPWVFYANTSEAQITPYDWLRQWAPLYEDARGLQANYYIQMLDSLPKSGIFFPDGAQTIYPTSVNGVLTLGPYEYTKTGYREDGTYRIQKIKRLGTEDVSTFTGYNIAVPPIAPPSPLDGHPFLGAREKAIYIETAEDLPTVLPSFEAIFQHAVPRTTNPYKDAIPFMKVYDIRLSQVPWSIWRESFPPVELIENAGPPTEISLKVEEGLAPSKVLTEVYKTSWYPGLASRKWLSQQLDGGTLVAKILLSQAGNLGPIAVPPPSILPPPVAIEGNAEDCLPSVITDFNDFADRGIFRSPRCYVCNWYGHGASTCPERRGPVNHEYKPGGGCIPLGFVSSERSEDIYIDKSAWTPGTDNSILQEYQKLISRYTERVVEHFGKAPEVGPAPPKSEAREMIVAILEDSKRTAEDKSSDISTLLDDTEHKLVNHLYSEKETGQFLICEHTLELNRGSFEKNAEEYLKNWTVKDSGFRTCKFCGERISEILEAQDQFDENGRVIQMRSKFSKPSFIPDEHISFAVSLKKLQGLFNSSEPAEDIFYLLLSLLQILPEEDMLKPILDFVRSESSKIKTKMAGKKLTSKEQSNIDLALALFGFNGVVILLQTHKPQLVPRRSFGSKPLVLRGFPRDSEDSSDAPLVDSLLNVLSNTFESYPSTFRGTSVIFLRNILNDKKIVRKLVISSLTKQFFPIFKDKLRKAKDSISAVDVSYILQNSFKPPIVRHTKDVSYLSPESSITDKEQTRFRCKDISPPWLVPSMPFSFKQQELNITIPLRPSSKAKYVLPFNDFPEVYTPEKEEIRTLLKIKVPAFKPLKTILENDNPEFLRNVVLEWMNLIVQSTTASVELKSYIREKRVKVVNSYENNSTLRDFFKGIIIEFVSLFMNDETLTSIIERSITDDPVIRSLLAKSEDSKRNVDVLRAREREEFKERMRRLPDAQRELRKELIDRGLAPYIITRDDREVFVTQLEAQMQLPTVEVEEVERTDIAPEDMNIDRDVGAQGEVPEANGQPLEYDYGDYGDMRARQEDAEEGDYAYAFADEEF